MSFEFAKLDDDLFQINLNLQGPISLAKYLELEFEIGLVIHNLMELVNTGFNTK